MFHEHRAAFLRLEGMTPDRATARLLPSDVAIRCRALPIAQDGGRITVAMADPTDHAARQAVTAALRRPSALAGSSPEIFLVQGNPALIDAWLADLAATTEEPAERPVDIWLRESPDNDETVRSYAEQIALLLSAALQRFDPLAAGRDWPDLSAPAGRRLLILPCYDASISGTLLAGEASSEPPQEWEERAPTLYVCRPRWPLSRLLLIVRGDPVDDAALEWAARLAHASGAAATALMVAPHNPATYAPPVHDDVSSLLSANNAMGHKMQHVLHSLAAMQLDAVLHLRQGAPEIVIREELASTPYDLAVAGVAVHAADAQWRLRPLLHKLLPEMNCPLLLTGEG